MHSARSAKSYYAAAFVFGSLLALLIVAPTRAEEAVRSDLEPLSSHSALQ